MFIQPSLISFIIFAMVYSIVDRPDKKADKKNS